MDAAIDDRGTVSVDAGEVGAADAESNDAPAGADGSEDAEPSDADLDAGADAQSEVDAGAARLTAAPLVVDFGTAVVGDRAFASIVVVNDGDAPGGVDSILIPPPFVVVANGCAGASLAPFESCSVNLAFEPFEPGAVSGQVTVSPASGAAAMVDAIGVGVRPSSLRITPSSYEFPTLQVGERAEATFVVENAGGVPSAVSMRIGGPNRDELELGSGCGLTLQPAATCTIAVAFAPSAPGVGKAGSLIATSDAGSVAMAALTGEGLLRARLTALTGTVGFGLLSVGGGNSTRIGFLNAGGGPTGPISMSFTGPHASDFLADTDCAAGLEAGYICMVDVGLRASALGVREALLIASSPYGGSAAVRVWAEGVVATPSYWIPVEMEFGQRVLNTTGSWLYPESVGDIRGPIPGPPVVGAGPTTYTISGPDAAHFRVVPNFCKGGAVQCEPSGVDFRPTTTGTKAATFTISNGVSQWNFNLSGGGIAASSVRFEVSRYWDKVSTQLNRNYVLNLRNYTPLPSPQIAIQLAGHPDYRITADGCTGLTLAPNAACTVNMRLVASGTSERHARLTATFGAEEAFVQLGYVVVPIPRRADVQIVRGGRVTGPGIECPADCSESAFTGSIPLTPIPHEGWGFTGWSGSCSGTGPCVIQGAGPIIGVIATFDRLWHAIQIVAAGRGGGSGTVQSLGSGISCGGSCSYAAEHGTKLELEAVPSPGSGFEGWTGACRGQGRICRLMITEPRMVSATFAPPNRVFVTSATVSLTSLSLPSNADIECTRLATLAGDAGSYVGWISTGTTTALARLASFDFEPRGWTRADDRPFVDSLVDLGLGRVLHPVLLDEGGTEVPAGAPIATGTREVGDLSGSCVGWTSPSTLYQSGSARAGSHGWTALDFSPCSDLGARIYCFGTDYRSPITVAPRATDRLGFITASAWDPSTGPAAADARCLTEALQAGLLGDYVAFLATPTTAATSHVGTNGPPWSRVDGVPIVDFTLDLSTGLIAPISVQADGVHAGEARVWTGVVGDPSQPGTPDSTCMGWTSAASSSFASVGAASLTTLEYADDVAPAPCSELHRLYCFQRQ
jgi:hypothetical protein